MNKLVKICFICFFSFFAFAFSQENGWTWNSETTAIDETIEEEQADQSA